MKAFIRYHTVDVLKLFFLKVNFILSKKHPILVYTMAKVGSMSVYYSIRKQTNYSCFHIHTLNLEEDLHNQEICLKNGLIPDSRTPIHFIQRKILKPKKVVKFITLYRNPIDRNISAFFDAFELYVGTSIENYKGEIEQLIQIYHEKMPHNYAVEWFNQVFERDLGINIYDYDFNPEIGFQTLVKDNYMILVLSSALDNSVKEEQIGQFINQQPFYITDVNVTASKYYKAKLYNEFKSTIKFSQSYLDTLLQSSYSQHFFTNEEIEASYKRWLEI